MGWEKGLAHLDQTKLKLIFDNTEDLNKGDVLILRKFKSEVSILKNNKITAQIEDAYISKSIFEPWIGESPIDKDLKMQLLKKNKISE